MLIASEPPTGNIVGQRPYRTRLALKDEANLVATGNGSDIRFHLKTLQYYPRKVSDTELSNFSTQVGQEGLVLNLDAGISPSYSGSGSTWYDLTGNGYNATLVNSPTHNSSTGYISFNGTTQYANQTVPLLKTAQDDFTFEVLFRMVTLPTAQYDTNGHIWGGEIGDDVVLYVNPASSSLSKLNLNYDDSRYPAESTGHITNSSISANSWVHWVCQGRSSDNTIAHYINGQLDKTFTSVVSGQENKNRNPDAQIAYDSRYSKYSQLDMGIIREYHRILSAQEILQNFNSVKDRYGL